MTLQVLDAMAWLPTSDTSLLDAAVAYASQGHRVHPVWWVKDLASKRCACGRPDCEKPGKHPIGAKWQKLTTCDADTVRDARRRYPHANVGMAMGGAMRIIAIDIDGDAGRASWAELEREVRPAPKTLSSRSGRIDGGEHLIYRVPLHLDIARIRNRSATNGLKGIDTRGENGQIVVAPSVHETGARYVWTGRIPIAEIPDWLFEAVAAQPEVMRPLAPAPSTPAPSPPNSPGGQVVDFVRPYMRKVIDNAATKIASTGKGGRNSLLFATSCTVFEYHVGEGLDHLEAWKRLADAGAAAGLPSGEVSSVLSKAWRKAQSQPRRVPPPGTTFGQSGNVSTRAVETVTTPGNAASSSAPVTTGPDVASLNGGGNGAGAARSVTSDEQSRTSTTGNEESGPRSVTTGGSGSGGGGDRSWETSLVVNGDGFPKNTFGNVCKILRHADDFRGRLSFNQMRVMPYIDGRPMRDPDFSRIRELMEARWGISPARAEVLQAVTLVADERAFHPVQDYLAGVRWDGQPRISRVAAEVCGSNDVDELTQRMLRCWFISAVARAMTPGCKVDTTLVLVGDQSFKKSTFFATLGGDWFGDSYVDIRSKDGVLQVHAAWIYEWSEIDRVTTRTNSSDVKAFLTIARDDVRPPYGMGVVNQPRSGVIVGTTNKAFLDDESGSRRFWPVRVDRRVDIGLLRTWREQLWGEAVAAFKGGEAWWLSVDEERARENVASEHTVENAWLERIGGYLKQPGRDQYGVTVSDVIVGGLGIDIGRLARGDETRVGKTLRQLGWSPRQEVRSGVRVRVYRPAAQRAVEVVTRLGEQSPMTSTSSQPSQPSQPVSNSIENREIENPSEVKGGVVGRAGCAEPESFSYEDDDDSFANWVDRQL